MPSAGRSVPPWQGDARGGTSSGLRSLGSQCGVTCGSWETRGTPEEQI